MSLGLDYNPLSNSKPATSLDADAKKISLLELIAQFTQSTSTTVSSNSSELIDIKEAIDFTNFELIPGNSKEITYWGGVDVTYNPSGNKNIDTIVYKTGVTTVLTQKFTWDAADDLVKITTS